MKLRHRINLAAAAQVLGILFISFLSSVGQERPASSAPSIAHKDALTKAETRLAHGDLAGAETPLWTVLTADPNDAAALGLLGKIRTRQQRYAEAESLFRRVLQINPNSLTAHRGLGDVLVAEKRPAEAIDQFQAALTLAPADVAIKVEIARLHADLEQFQQSLDTLSTIPKSQFPIEAFPVKAVGLLATGRAEEAAQLPERAKSSPAVEMGLAQAFLDAKLPGYALHCLEYAAADLKKHPPRFYYLQGRALQSLGKPEAALDSLKQARTADPTSIDTLVAISEVEADRNLHKDAVAELQKALELSPDNVVVLRHLVEEATNAGNAQASLAAALELSAKSPENPDDLYLSGAAMLQQNSSAASSVLEKYVALQSDNAKAWLGLGMSYVQQHKYAEARGPLERSIKLDPNTAEAEYELGVVARNVGTSDEAIQHFERAVQLQPQHAKAQWNLGNLYLQTGDLQKAREDLQSAESIDPNSPETEYDLGLVLSRLGKPELAKEHFERYRKLKEAQPPAERDAR